MAGSAATVATPRASRYLQQLCKHWSHRFSVTFDHTRGEIDFGNLQSVELSAAEASLVVTARDSDEAGLAELEQVVADHLARFAFRETLEFRWVPVTEAGAGAPQDQATS